MVVDDPPYILSKQGMNPQYRACTWCNDCRYYRRGVQLENSFHTEQNGNETTMYVTNLLDMALSRG